MACLWLSWINDWLIRWTLGFDRFDFLFLRLWLIFFNSYNYWRGLGLFRIWRGIIILCHAFIFLADRLVQNLWLIILLLWEWFFKILLRRRLALRRCGFLFLLCTLRCTFWCTFRSTLLAWLWICPLRWLWRLRLRRFLRLGFVLRRLWLHNRHVLRVLGRYRRSWTFWRFRNIWRLIWLLWLLKRNQRHVHLARLWLAIFVHRHVLRLVIHVVDWLRIQILLLQQDLALILLLLLILGGCLLWARSLLGARSFVGARSLVGARCSIRACLFFRARCFLWALLWFVLALDVSGWLVRRFCRSWYLKLIHGWFVLLSRSTCRFSIRLFLWWLFLLCRSCTLIWLGYATIWTLGCVVRPLAIWLLWRPMALSVSHWHVTILFTSC